MFEILHYALLGRKMMKDLYEEWRETCVIVPNKPFRHFLMILDHDKIHKFKRFLSLSLDERTELVENEGAGYFWFVPYEEILRRYLKAQVRELEYNQG